MSFLFRLNATVPSLEISAEGVCIKPTCPKVLKEELLNCNGVTGIKLLNTLAPNDAQKNIKKKISSC
mgnify:CR=1 FL=1